MHLYCMYCNLSLSFHSVISIKWNILETNYDYVFYKGNLMVCLTLFTVLLFLYMFVNNIMNIMFFAFYK